LSRREFQPGDEEWPRPDEEDLEHNGPLGQHSEWDYCAEQPLELEEFKNEIDTRGGYLQEVREPAMSIEDFGEELGLAYADQRILTEYVKKGYKAEGMVVPAYIQIEETEEGLLPDEGLRNIEEKREPYDEEHRSQGARNQDKYLKLVVEWLKDTLTRPDGMTEGQQYQRFIRYASQFYLSQDGKLYRQGMDGAHHLVVWKEHRMYMMRTVHDALGHCGGFATTSLLEQRFWWPDIKGDVRWYIKTCMLCQK
jgi:hypothetical protein